MKISIKKLHPHAHIPSYQSTGASGFDLHALEDMVLAPQSVGLVRTGLAIALEEGYELQVRSRSGLALQHQIVVLNSPGTVDSDYRGELKVVLMNFSPYAFSIGAGDRIAQGVVGAVQKVHFVEVEELPDSTRGTQGFGSTGK